ncbi:MAG TPA: hypothetical protein VEH83_05200 [Gemmatimonadales bacterium]|nr:hypothetical protein [Gemmatimonadales bacterium]
MRLVSRLPDVLLVLLLLASAFFGLREGVPLARSARTAGQWTATVTEILYGIAAVGVLLWGWRRAHAGAAAP